MRIQKLLIYPVLINTILVFFIKLMDIIKELVIIDANLKLI
jgi:hypothetical protein